LVPTYNHFLSHSKGPHYVLNHHFHYIGERLRAAAATERVTFVAL